MARPIEELLDEALYRQWHNGSGKNMTADALAEVEALRPLLETAASLETLMPVQMPDPGSLAADRERFLNEVTELRPLAVFPSPLARLRGWLSQRLSMTSYLLRPREQNRMNVLLLRAAFVLVVALGSIGGTAALAADSLPDSPLYPLKMTMEEARLSLADSPADEAGLQLSFAEERLIEIENMIRAGRAPGEETMVRLEEHLGQSFYLAAQTSDETLSGLLHQARDMAQIHEQTMAGVQEDAGEQMQTMLQQSVQLMAQVRETCDLGLSDPRGFREEFGTGSRNRFGQWEEAPGNGSGPGPGECEVPGECEPTGDQNQYGRGGDDSGQYGPGPDECPDPSDCEPVGDQNQYGLGDDVPGQHGPGPAECSEPGECEPAGDQHQYGPGGGDPGQHGPGPYECADPGECEPTGNQAGEQNGPGPGHQEQNQEQGGAGPGNDDGSGSGGQHQEQNTEQNGEGSGGMGGSDQGGSGGSESGGPSGSGGGSGGGRGG